LLPHIIRIYNSGADIASNCSGAFFLAKAGLLNHRNATTHWGYAEKLAKEYPLINLKESALVTQSDNIFCAAGGSAFYDLGLLLIERFCGRDIASQSAKTQVIDSRRSSQNAYAKVNLHKRHNDALISMIQDFIEDNYAAPLSINLLCEQFNLIPRTLNRRFQKSANMRPIQYIQTIRIEQAKRLLEQEQIQIKALANLVGYDDSSSFNRLFKKQTGLSPKEYKDTCYKTPNF
jgi:transcriptional regulator GlxA family with amidase domain